MTTGIRADSPGWLAARSGCVTASRVRDVLDVRKDGKPGAAYKRYLAEVVAERLTGMACDHPVTWPMRRGTEQQPFACAAYEAETGNIVGPELYFEHPTIAYSGATPDGTVEHDGLVEFKVPLSHNFVSQVLDGGIPEDHTPQLIWQLACTRRTWVDYVAFCPDIPGPAGLHIVRYQPTAEQIAEVESKVIAFLAEVEFAFKALTEGRAA